LKEKIKFNFLNITRNIFLLAIVSFLNDLSSEMIMPIIPSYLITILGTSKILSGSIMGVIEALSSLFKVLFGYISDKFKKRKLFIMLGYGISTASKALLAFSHFWWDFLGLRALDRIGKGIRTAPRDALIAISTKSNKTGTAFGFHRMLDTFGAILGPLITILFLEHLKNYPLEKVYRILFLISSIPGIIAILVIYFFVKDSQGIVKKTIKNISALRDSNLILFFIVIAIASLGRYSYAFTIWKLQELGYSTLQLIGFYAFFNFIYAFSSYPFGIYSDKIGKKYIIILGFLISTFASLMFSKAKGITTLVIGFILYGFYLAIEDTVPRAYLADIAKNFEKATVIGAYHTIFGIFVFPASLICGWLWQTIGIDYAFLYAAIMSSLAMFLMLFVKK